MDSFELSYTAAIKALITRKFPIFVKNEGITHKHGYIIVSIADAGSSTNILSLIASRIIRGIAFCF